MSNGAHPSDYAARELWTAIPCDSLENLRVVPNFRVADDSARTSFAFQNHLWTMKSFVWSLVISTAMLKRESHEGHAPIGPAGRRTNARMKAKRQFSDDVLAVLQEGKGLRIRAGTSQHRFIGIWAVVVEDRAFIRSWSVKPNGWYRTFLKDPRGTIQVAGHKIAVRAVHVRDERLRDAIDRAYLEKYNTAGALEYAKDLGSPKSRATTVELEPRSLTH